MTGKVAAILGVGTRGGGGHTMLSPDAIADTYWRLHALDPTAWTLELDLRPSVESF